MSSDIMGFSNTPAYVTEQMLLTKDTKNIKPLDLGQNSRKKLWDRWLKVKREITGSINVAVKVSIAQMPGGPLPSGTDLELFLTRLMYELHTWKKKTNILELSDNAEEGGKTGHDLEFKWQKQRDQMPKRMTVLKTRMMMKPDKHQRFLRKT